MEAWPQYAGARSDGGMAPIAYVDPRGAGGGGWGGLNRRVAVNTKSGAQFATGVHS